MLNQAPIDIKVISASCSLLSKIFQVDKPSSIELVMKLGFIAKFDNMLDFDSENLINNLLWFLINITSMSKKAVIEIINLNMHKKIIKLMDKPSDECLINVIDS